MYSIMTGIRKDVTIFNKYCIDERIKDKRIYNNMIENIEITTHEIQEYTQSTTIVIPERLKLKFTRDWKEKQIMVFSAFCGFGKTAVVKELLQKIKYCWRDVARDENVAKSIPKGVKAIVIDQIHLLHDIEQQMAICDLIYKHQNVHFIFMTRGTLPKWLMGFQLHELLRVYRSDMLHLQPQEIITVMKEKDILITSRQAEEIYRLSHGYPLVILLYCSYLKDSYVELPVVMPRIKREVFEYLEMVVFNQYPMAIRRLLLCTAQFEEFGLELVQIISGNADVQKELNYLLEDSTIISLKNDDKYEYVAQFREFLIWKMKRVYSEREQRAFQSRAGVYFELQNQLKKAMECYMKAEEYKKVTELLEYNGNLNPGIGQYMEMEVYYRKVPQHIILQSPSLMCGMSMLESLRAHYEKSEQWYEELATYFRGIEPHDVEYMEIQQKLLFLDIALPHRSNESLKRVFMKAFKIASKKKLVLPEFSITTGAISMINGGKDFTDWCKYDELIYKTMKAPVEAVLGREGVGIAECGLCESKFEKGERYQKYLVRMVSAHTEILQKGCLDTDVAFHGILARIYISQGKIESATELVNRILEKVIQQGEYRYVSNIKALLCHIYLLTGEIQKVDEWYQNDAPADSLEIWTLWRYQYLIKAEVMIQKEEYLDAILLLAPVLAYSTKCQWHMDEIQCYILSAICFYRLKDETWKQYMEEAMEIAEQMHLVQTVAQYGGAVLPLLKEMQEKKDNKFFRDIIKETKAQAMLFHNYLQPISATKETLSEKEMQVVTLICQNKSNQEISEILDISLSTVKTHVSNIFRKLEVSKRGEVKTEAMKQNLVESYLWM